MARDGVLTFQVGTADISELGAPLCVMSPSTGCLRILWWQLRRATRSQLLGGPVEGEGPSHRGFSRGFVRSCAISKFFFRADNCLKIRSTPPLCFLSNAYFMRPSDSNKAMTVLIQDSFL